MNYQEQAAILSAVYFNEVVATAQRTNASHSSVQINLICTAQLSQIDFGIQCVKGVSDLSAIRDFLSDQSIQFGKINITFCNFNRLHAAANIDANHTGNDLILDGHGGADGTALTGMHIRHDADLATGKLHLIAHRLNLLRCQFLQLGSVTDSGII